MEGVLRLLLVATMIYPLHHERSEEEVIYVTFKFKPRQSITASFFLRSKIPNATTQ